MENIFKSSFTFINIGRLTEQKGQWYLIKSFRKVVDKYEDVKLCIIGEGELKEDLNELIKILKLENNVFLLGNQENVFPFLRNSNYFVLSSLWEGFGLVLLEALSVNLKIISVDCKFGPKEVLCPELDFRTNNNIEYPYYGKYGTLTLPFNEKYNYDIKENSVSNAEKMLSTLMIEAIQSSYSENIRTFKPSERIQTFDKNIIINKWDSIIG